MTLTNSIYSQLYRQAFPFIKPQTPAWGEPAQTQPDPEQQPVATAPTGNQTVMGNIPWSPSMMPEDGNDLPPYAQPATAYHPDGMPQPTGEPRAVAPMDTTGLPGMKAPPPTMPDYSNLSDSERELAEARWGARHAPDQNHGWKSRIGEVIGNFMAGVGQAGPNADWAAMLGAGGASAGVGAFDRTLNERRDAAAKIPGLEHQVQFNTDQRTKSAQAAVLEGKPAQAQAEFARKTRKDQVVAQYNNDRIALGQSKADDIKYWREQKLDLEDQKIGLQGRALDQKDAQIKQADRKIEELIRSNKAGETQSAINEQGRNSRFGTGQKNSMAKVNISSADHARSVLQSVEVEGGKRGATPEQIEAKKQQVLGSLTPEVRKQLGLP